MNVAWTTVPLALAATLVAADALAQRQGVEALGGRHRSFESPQHFAFEVRFSPFLPEVDTDPALHGAPYASTFGSGHYVLYSAELDWQAARIPHVGTIGPGLGAGYWTRSEPAVIQGTSTPSAESTSLTVYPLYAVAVLRGDALWREIGIPIVPYAKIGLGVAFWRVSNTLGTSSFQGVSGKGHTFGTELALGAALNLNVFDEYAAKTFDESIGVNSTYAFLEWTRADLTGLWLQQGPLRVGGTSWTLGLAFEF